MISMRYYFKTKEEAEKFIEEGSAISGELTDASLKAAFPDLVEDGEEEPGYTVKVIFGDYGATFVLYEMKEETKKIVKFLRITVPLVLGYIWGKKNCRFVRLSKVCKKGLTITPKGDTIADYVKAQNKAFIENNVVFFMDKKKKIWSGIDCR